MRDEARPSDVCLFHDDVEEYLGQANSNTIAILISSHRRAITNSVKKFANTSLTGATTILQWVRGSNNDEAIARIQTIEK